jgi:hypothetical protein
MGIKKDPKIEVLYRMMPYFVGIFPYIALIYGRYLQFRFLKWPLMKWVIGDKTEYRFILGNLHI